VAKGRRESWSRRRFPAAHYLPKQGKFVEAGQRCRRALEGFREVLGSNHPCRIQAANNLLPWFTVYSILSWNLSLVNHANLDLDQFKPNLRVFIVYQLTPALHHEYSIHQLVERILARPLHQTVRRKTSGVSAPLSTTTRSPSFALYGARPIETSSFRTKQRPRTSTRTAFK
jgi:hypothetical protein